MNPQAEQISIALGEVVAHEMWLQRVSQKRIAEALGVTQGCVSSRLRGKVSIKVPELAIIADVLGTHPVELVKKMGKRL